MNHKKLECLVEGYEGTYFEIGQVCASSPFKV